LIALARANGGILTAAQVEADAELVEDRNVASAAAHALAGSTNAFGSSEGAAGWFPYAEIRITDLRS
jgi:hypothetical protein